MYKKINKDVCVAQGLYSTSDGGLEKSLKRIGIRMCVSIYMKNMCVYIYIYIYIYRERERERERERGKRTFLPLRYTYVFVYLFIHSRVYS